MARLGEWLSMGVAMAGIRDAEPVGAAVSACDDRHHDLIGGGPGESRIVYPLGVGEWQAVGEHRYDEQEYGVSVRYVHGQDRDRWIDVYFYPAGALSAAQFAEAAKTEADLIERAHRQAGHSGFHMSDLQPFPVEPNPAGAGAAIPAFAVDLVYASDGVAYSSAMTLLLDRLYFIKARYSIERATSSREHTLRQLERFTVRLHRDLLVLGTGDRWMRSQVDAGHDDATGAPAQRGLSPGCMGASSPGSDVSSGMREIRIEYPTPDDDAHASGIDRVKVG